MSSTILLQGGTVIQLDENDKLSSVKADVLIKDDTIVQIESSITPPAGCDIVDCTDKIISPGFVDTHRHMWETALKGLCEDLTCVHYFSQMWTSSFVFTPEDLFWTTLAGCAEAVDAGTTTILDFAHMNWTKHHGKQSLAGTITSGIRSVFALAPTVTLKQTSPTVEMTDDGLIPEWFMPLLRELATCNNIASPLSSVSLAFGFDYYFLPMEMIQALFQEVKSLGIKTITSHWARFPGQEESSLPRQMREYGILDKSIVLSHLGGATKDDAEVLCEAGTFVSASPSVEMTMGLGPPVVFRDDLPNMDSICSLGVDSHHATSGSMLNEMRVALMSARGNDAQTKLAAGEMADKVCRTAHDAFIMSTIRGARALGMEDSIGSIKVGKKADLVIFDTLSPAMTIAAQCDPVTAIVVHSSVADVNTVIVNGHIRKRDGKLLPFNRVEWQDDKSDFVATGALEWKEVSAPVLDAHRRFTAKLPEHDMGVLNAFVKRLYGMP